MTGMESIESWQERFSAMVGRAIDQARKGRSDQWISDQAAMLGHPISRTAVSEYRRGKRKSIPVTDLIVMARALEVPPVSLLFPGLPNRLVPAMPPGMTTSDVYPSDSEVPAFDALRWFTGESQVIPSGWDVGLDPDTGDVAHMKVSFDYMTRPGFSNPARMAPSTEFDLLEACRAFATACARLHALSYDFMMLSDSERKERLKLLDQAANEIEITKKWVRELGGDLSEYSEGPDARGDD